MLLHVDEMPTTNLYEDNTAALNWCYNPANHAKQKHIPVACHFVREQVSQFETFNVVPISTDMQLADMFTKCLPAPRLRFLIDTVRGLHPTPVARPTTTPLSEVADTVHSAVKSMQVSLKERLKTQKQPDMEPFFGQHFEEPDPLLLQGQGLRRTAAAAC